MVLELLLEVLVQRARGHRPDWADQEAEDRIANLIRARGRSFLDAWERIIDLRVEDDPDPLGELRRLLTVARRASGVSEAGAETVIGDADGHAADVYGAVPGTAYLIRPDGHVAGRWKHLDPASVPPALARAAALSTQEG